MRMKPLLAIATLAVAIAGCSVSPQTHVIDPALVSSRPAPRVTLDVQGLGTGTISSTRLKTDVGATFEIDRASVSYNVVHIVPRGTELPAGASIERYLNDANGDGVYPADEVYHDEEPADYTHFVYRFGSLRDDEIAWMQVSFKAEGYEADGLVSSSEHDIIATHRFGEGEASRNATPFLRFAPDAPATLRFAWMNWTTESFETQSTLDVDAQATYDTYDTHRFELDLSLTTQDGKPMLGITKDHIDLQRFALKSDSWWEEANPVLGLEERGNGAYTIGIDFQQSAVPTSIDVALSLKNVPMIRDVEY